MIALSPEMLGLIAPAFCAGLVVAATHVPLGQEVLRRGIIFIDLAIAQIAALGMVVSHIVFGLDYGLAPYGLAMGFALLGGGLFAWLERRAPARQEAFIGSAFVLSACLILILLAGDPHGGEHVQGLLAGQILWASWRDIAVTAAVYAAILILWFRFSGNRGLLFYILFPVAVTLSVKLVGIYLVFASLIIPALGALKFRRHLIAGYAISLAALAFGLLVSVKADLPSGPVIVCAYAISAMVFSVARSYSQLIRKFFPN